MRRLLLLGSFFMSFGLAAQTIAIKKIELAGDKVIVYFDLEDSNTTNEYLLNLYASKDNFISPLTKVKGDIGTDVKPGLDKKVEWSILEEFGPYKGRISLELRGKVFVAFVKLKNFDDSKPFKRGKPYDILWKAGSTDAINIEFFKGTDRIQGDMNRPNSGNYVLNIPSNAKPGKDYRIKFSSTKSDDVIYSPYFKVVPKVSTAIKAAGALVVIGGVIVAAGGKSSGDGGGGTTVTDTPITVPPLPGH